MLQDVREPSAARMSLTTIGRAPRGYLQVGHYCPVVTCIPTTSLAHYQLAKQRSIYTIPFSLFPKKEDNEITGSESYMAPIFKLLYASVYHRLAPIYGSRHRAKR